jgi:hypothetical protein
MTRSAVIADGEIDGSPPHGKTEAGVGDGDGNERSRRR